jgi:hypothetical protein
MRGFLIWSIYFLYVLGCAGVLSLQFLFKKKKKRNMKKLKRTSHPVETCNCDICLDNKCLHPETMMGKCTYCGEMING